MSLDLIRSHTLNAGNHVGDLLWWTLTDARITRSLLESVWTNAGLAPGLLPEPPTPEKALKTAVRESAVGQHDHLLRLGKEDDNEIIFAVMRETRDSAGNVSLAQETRVRLDRNAPARLDSDRPGHDLVVAISAAYDRLLTTHTADDVRRLVDVLEGRRDLARAVRAQPGPARVAHDREQPGPRVAATERGKETVSPQKCLLNHVIRIVVVAREPAREVVGGWQEGQDHPLEVRPRIRFAQETPPPW